MVRRLSLKRRRYAESAPMIVRISPPAATVCPSGLVHRTERPTT